MPDISTLLLLAAVFLCISYCSASVGLGGGSCYTALLAVSGVAPLAIPLISLSLNLIVTSAGSYQFIRHRHASWKIITPFLVTSMPMAYLGGSLHLPKGVFYGILFASLTIVVIRIFFYQKTSLSWNLKGWQKLALSLIAGALLGFIAGVVGIGGGIYLVPFILIVGLGTEKQAAASGAIFIWLNSITGLIARLHHHSVSLLDYYPLMIAVAVGGMLGAALGATSLKPRTMQKILGTTIIIALCLLIQKLV
ncbi:sulfite exporter TauE/SafE family protein [Verrucomicrobiaceae bacterium 5K15]|uniref:Probable membrane transporter protein n=1 Tax=Oceaniferula flava TaxID=2800421 RepID=A0AAE2SFS6_9BACT|nr:sulfite exporter TauE/SafE family protein [Oceaniferula flavus]MBK1856172.1 sulfite exporter TauE/SafE family protein [Oceaniferula flavus]MBM1137479.1 sulfite exporter TauE/SafE family protein [Oceaniferula flavus]